MVPLHTTRPLIGVALAALLLSLACQTKIEQSPAFKDQADRLDRTDKDVDATRRKLSVIDRDLQQVTLDVSELAKHAAQGNPQLLHGFEQRLVKLEQVLKSAGQSLAALDGRMAKLEDSLSKANLQVASLAERSDSSGGPSGKVKLVATMKKGAKAPRKAAAKASTPKTGRPRQSAKPEGVYYQVAQGESLEQIAKSHRVSLATLHAANRLPKGSSILPGQKLYVPAQR